MTDNKQTLHGQGPQMSGQEAIHTLLQRLSELSVHQHRLVVTFDHLRGVVEKIIERFSRFSFLLAMQGGARNLLPYGLHNMLGGGGGSHRGSGGGGGGGYSGGGGGGGSGPFDFAKALKDALDYAASKNMGKQELDYRGHLIGKARKAAFKMGTPLDEEQVLKMMGSGDIKDLQAYVKTLEETAYHRPDEQARASFKDNTAAIRRVIKEAIKGSGVDIDASALRDIVSQLADKVIKGFAEQKEVTKARLSAKVDQGALDLHDNVVMIDTETVGLGSRGVSPDAISVSATTVGEDGQYKSAGLFLPMEKEVEELHEALKSPDFAPANEKQQILFNTLEETARILGHTIEGSEDKANNYKISGMEKGLGDPKALLNWWRAALDKQSPEAQKAFVDFIREAFSTKALGAHNLPFDRGVLLKIFKKLGVEDVNLPSDETGTERAVDTAEAIKIGDKKSNLNELIKVAGGIAAVTKWLEEHGAPKKLVEAVANRESVHDAEADAAATLASLHLLRNSGVGSVPAGVKQAEAVAEEVEYVTQEAEPLVGEAAAEAVVEVVEQAVSLEEVSAPPVVNSTLPTPPKDLSAIPVSMEEHPFAEDYRNPGEVGRELDELRKLRDTTSGTFDSIKKKRKATPRKKRHLLNDAFDDLRDKLLKYNKKIQDLEKELEESASFAIEHPTSAGLDEETSQYLEPGLVDNVLDEMDAAQEKKRTTPIDIGGGGRGGEPPSNMDAPPPSPGDGENPNNNKKKRWRNLDNAEAGALGPLANFMGYLKGSSLPDSAEDGLNKVLQPQKKWFTWFGNTQKQSDAAKKNFTEILKKVSEKGLLGVAAGAAKGAMPLAATMGSQMLSAGNPVAFQTLMDSFALLAGRLSMMLLPTVMDLIGYLQGMANWIQELSPAAKGWIGFLVKTGAYLAGAVIAISAFVKAIMGITAALAVFGLKLSTTSVALGIGGLAGAGVALMAASYAITAAADYFAKKAEGPVDPPTTEATVNKYHEEIQAGLKDPKHILNQAAQGGEATARFLGIKEGSEDWKKWNSKGEEGKDFRIKKTILGMAKGFHAEAELEARNPDGHQTPGLAQKANAYFAAGQNGFDLKTMLKSAFGSNVNSPEKRGEIKALEEKNKEIEKQKGMLLSLRAMAASPQYSDIGNAYKKVQLDVLSKDPMLLALEKMQREGLEKMIALQQESNQHLQSISGEAKRTVGIDKK